MSYTICTYFTRAHPRDSQKALRSRVAFLSLVIGFPAVAFTAYIAVSSRLHAVRNYVDMTCDASDPLWCVVIYMFL